MPATAVRAHNCRSILAVVLALAAAPAAIPAEDGYDLWLRYAPIEHAALRAGINRARLRGSLVVEVGRAAGGDRSEAARLRARERVARPERHRSQQRERERAVAYRWLHRQGRRHRRHVPA